MRADRHLLVVHFFFRIRVCLVVRPAAGAMHGGGVLCDGCRQGTCCRLKQPSREAVVEQLSRMF